MLLASNEQFVRFDRAKVAQITNLRAATSTHYRGALPVLKFRIISANLIPLPILSYSTVIQEWKGISARCSRTARPGSWAWIW